MNHVVATYLGSTAYVVKAENQELRAMINELSVALERLELLTSGIEH